MVKIIILVAISIVLINLIVSGMEVKGEISKISITMVNWEVDVITLVADSMDLITDVVKLSYP